MHGGPVRRHGRDHNPACCILGKQGTRHLGDGLPRGSLTHSDEYRAIANRHDVATLEGGHAMISLGAAIPDLEVTLGEDGVTSVNGASQDGFLLTSRPTHWIEGDTAEDPCRGISSELSIGQRRNEKFSFAVRLDKRAKNVLASLRRHFAVGHATNEILGQGVRRHVIEPVPNILVNTQPNRVRGQLPVKYPGTTLRDIKDLGQQLMHLMNDNSTFSHLGHEISRIFLCFFNPQDVIKEQFSTIAWGEPTMRQTRLTHHHLTKLANFRPCTNGSSHFLTFHRGEASSLPWQSPQHRRIALLHH